ncbi:hypothetical protein J4446_03425 [Candidatus Woesearchaeota archaeon]|nr:hypothetical protein [Candidatus Woesearchaeota archaeon]
MSNILVNKTNFVNSYEIKECGFKAYEKYRCWFPVKPSERLAGIIADLMGDGHIQGNGPWRLDFTSKYKKELLRFENEIYSLFKVKGKIRPCTTNKYSTYNYGVNCKPLIKILEICGAPSGAKVLKSFKISDWIINNKKYYKSFIKRLFLCEGHLGKNEIKIEMAKAEYLIKDGINFMESIREKLKEFYGFNPTNIFIRKYKIRKDKIQTYGIQFKIKRKEEIPKFYNLIMDQPSKHL